MILDKEVYDWSRGITYKKRKLSLSEKIKIFFGAKDKRRRIKVKSKLLCDLIPKVYNFPKFKLRIGDIV